MHLSRATFKLNKDAGYFPYFQFVLRSRIKRKKAVNVVVTGEAGEGKSYEAWTLALLVDKHFTVDQIVYTYADYMRLLRYLPLGRAIMFDEPSYAMGKRDWYRQINKVLVQTIESQRFKVHPLFIPIINKSLLDKTIRDHLIQFQVEMYDRGRAQVFRVQASQKEEKVYYHWLCELRYPMIGNCTKDSCLGCRKLKRCLEFRAQYERKKAEIQNKRYEQAEAEAEHIETRELTFNQIKIIALNNNEIKHQLEENKNIDAMTLRIILRDQERIPIGRDKSYELRKAILRDYLVSQE